MDVNDNVRNIEYFISINMTIFYVKTPIFGHLLCSLIILHIFKTLTKFAKKMTSLVKE